MLESQKWAPLIIKCHGIIVYGVAMGTGAVSLMSTATNYESDSTHEFYCYRQLYLEMDEKELKKGT